MLSGWFSQPSCICGARRGRLCFCDEIASMGTSWSVGNPERIHACSFSDWLDDSGNEAVIQPEKMWEFMVRMSAAKNKAEIGKMKVYLAELKMKNAVLLNWLVGGLCLSGFTCVLVGIMSI